MSRGLTTNCAFSWSFVADFFFCLFNNLLCGEVRELAVIVGLKSIFFSVLKWGEPVNTTLYVYICRETDHTVPQVGMCWDVNPLWPQHICRTTSGNILVIRNANPIHPSSQQRTKTISEIESWRDYQCQFQELRLPGAGPATVGRRLSLWLGGCQGHRGKGRNPQIGWLAVSMRDFGVIYLDQRLPKWIIGFYIAHWHIRCPASTQILLIFPRSQIDETPQICFAFWSLLKP